MKFKAVVLAISLGLASTAAVADDMDRGIMAFLKGDNDTALQVFRPLAEHGNKEAQYHLGYMYQTGIGVEQNSSEALHWYEMAALQGHNSASVQARVVARMLKN
jgi:TPR repeat protein